MYSDFQKEAAEKMSKTISVYKEELQSIRAGRANPSILDRMTVDYYGQSTPLKQVASISAPEPRLLVIQPWDATLIPIIEKEIQKSDLGINPSNDGKLIRLQIPQLTEERRLELIKIVKKNGEQAKVAIRNTRRDGIDKIKKLEKDKNLPEDERKSAEDEITSSKEEELLEI